MGRSHCAVTLSKGRTITPEERTAMGVFMQEACPNGRKCGRCPDDSVGFLERLYRLEDPRD